MAEDQNKEFEKRWKENSEAAGVDKGEKAVRDEEARRKLGTYEQPEDGTNARRQKKD